MTSNHTARCAKERTSYRKPKPSGAVVPNRMNKARAFSLWLSRPMRGGVAI